MRKIMTLILCLLLILCSGCSMFTEEIQNMTHSKDSGSLTSFISGGNTKPATEAVTQAATEPVTQPTQETTVPATVSTEPVPQPTMETIPVVTRPNESAQQPNQSYGGGYSDSYLQKIYLGQAIYTGPGYNYKYVRGVEETNNYTIVDEAYDSSGNLWGKLKSGVGWVDLTDIRYGGYDYDYDYDYDYSWGYGQYYSVNYVTKIKDDSCPIYSTPSYYGSYVGTVQEAGSYTIVQETYDAYGRLWGKLKSGLGWVCLSDYT